MRLSGPQSRSGRHWEVKILIPTGTWNSNASNLKVQMYKSNFKQDLRFTRQWILRLWFWDVRPCILVDCYKGTCFLRHYGFFKIGIVGGGGGGVLLGPLGTAATNGLRCQPRVIMMMEKLMEWLAWETEVLGENVSQCRFVHHSPHMLPGREPGSPRWEASY
jgi:hypothetical protein